MVYDLVARETVTVTDNRNQQYKEAKRVGGQGKKSVFIESEKP
jgi:hypothetical protein